MNLLILSPLFPPDPGHQADYTKAIATHLSSLHHTSLLVYGYLPETVPHIISYTIDKRRRVFVRVFLFIVRLLSIIRSKNHVIINNGLSVELPFLIVSLLYQKSFTLVVSDPYATTAERPRVYRLIHALLKQRASAYVVITDAERTLIKPEYLPFTHTYRPHDHLQWWSGHLRMILPSHA